MTCPPRRLCYFSCQHLAFNTHPPTHPLTLSPRLSPQYPGNIPRVSVGYRNEVEVDCNSDIHLYDLEQYRGACVFDFQTGRMGGGFVNLCVLVDQRGLS
jgi:hypothetical protein